ncbi:hypothetical protein HIM_07349 [Hirsutella minnesotensis 3608]|uniref:Helicase ATP-binding domain-containing protein n=1 Tax=Hirsutella minnesotensis 3608 TaxID=1043627 RepID=A0A0F7ZN92_9HYPO|nr:hypothetical protein HIM_07349 [Hirsutella minnesotensis 3608]
MGNNRNSKNRKAADAPVRRSGRSRRPAETEQHDTPENAGQKPVKARKPAANKEKTNTRQTKNVNAQLSTAASNPIDTTTADGTENIYDVSDDNASDEDMDGVVQGSTMPRLPTLSKHAYGYKSILSLDTVETTGAWFKEPNNQEFFDFSFWKPDTPPEPPSEKQKFELAKSWGKCSYPPGVLVAYQWEPTVTAVDPLAKYLGLKNAKYLAAFADAAVYKECKRPTFVPIPNRLLYPNNKANAINPPATTAVTALQILMFAPKSLKDGVPNLGQDDYEKRFPTPPDFGNGEEGINCEGAVHIGPYGLEDLNRAVLLLQLACTRRERPGIVSKRTAPEKSKSVPAHIYHDPSVNPDNFRAEDATTLSNIMNQRSLRLESAMENMRAIAAELPPSERLEGADAMETHTEICTGPGALPHILHHVCANLGLCKDDTANLLICAHKECLMVRKTDIAKSGLKAGTDDGLTVTNDIPHPRVSEIKDLVRHLTAMNGRIDPVKRAQEVDKTIDPFLDDIRVRDVTQLTDFRNNIRESDHIRQYAAENPTDAEGLDRRLIRSFKLELQSNAHAPPEAFDWDTARSEYNIGQNNCLYNSDSYSAVQPLLPHQVADVSILMERVKLGISSILGNEMGLGKTREMLALIEVNTRYRETLKSTDDTIKFHPTLIVNPVATITQTAHESEQFPSLNVWVYYGEANGYTGSKNVNSIKPRALVAFLEALDRDDPKTGRTVILTTGNTLSVREINKTEDRIIIRKRKQELPRKRPAQEEVDNPQRKRTNREPSSTAADDHTLRTSEEDDHPPVDADATTSEPIQYPAEEFNPADWETDQEALERKRIGLGDIINDSRLKNVFADAVPAAVIIKVSREANIEPDANLITYSLKHPRLAHQKFQFLMVDEAHCAKKMTGMYNNSFRLLNWDTSLWVSGTVLISSLKDILSPLFLFWLKLDMPTYGWLTDGHHLGDLQLLFHQDYDPTSRSFELNGRTVLGLFHEDTDFSRSELGIRLKDFWVKHKFPIWVLCQTLVSAACDATKWNVGAGMLVVGGVLRNLCLRRTLKTPLRLEDNSIIYPALELPPMKIIYEELQFSKEFSAAVKRHGDMCAKSMTNAPVAGDVPDMTRGQAGEAIANPSDAIGSQNFGAYREGVFGAFDARNRTLMSKEVGHLFMPKSGRTTISSTIRDIRDSRIALTTTEVARSMKNSADAAVAGVEHLKTLRDNSNFGAIEYLYLATRSDPHVPTLTSPMQWARWHLASSPISLRVIQLCTEYVLEKGRNVVVFVDTPWIQELVVSILDILGFNVVTTRPSDKQAHKQSVIDDFNNPAKAAQVFVANINTMAVGVNLQGACSLGILIAYPHNAKTTNQICARLHRIGQKKPVIWHFIRVKDSFHDHQERMSLEKWARQLSAEMRAWFRHTFNRYAWTILRPLNPSSFEPHSKETAKVGHAISIIARLVLSATDEESQTFWMKASTHVVNALIILADKESWQDLVQAQTRPVEEIHAQMGQKVRDAIGEAQAASERGDLKSKERRRVSMAELEVRKALAEKEAAGEPEEDCEEVDDDDAGLDDGLEYDEGGMAAGGGAPDEHIERDGEDGAEDGDVE